MNGPVEFRGIPGLKSRPGAPSICGTRCDPDHLARVSVMSPPGSSLIGFGGQLDGVAADHAFMLMTMPLTLTVKDNLSPSILPSEISMDRPADRLPCRSAWRRPA